ncbi:CVNH domain-containing protein [Aspergillus bertholletiae]|uniref:CVNH domain-containing protein n=1 Tax=Aspergillus bertholletiae TaxID=1226010 RepID=A0A5N7BHK7_9EURO|nr:CVNH domain-containing protein [Aspergillus bertholletiae]
MGDKVPPLVRDSEYKYQLSVLRNLYSALSSSLFIITHLPSSILHQSTPLANMSFHLSAENIRVEEDHVLVADLEVGDGSRRHAVVDLNVHLGNNNGHFQWDGHNFSETARGVHFAIEGGGQVPVLRAELRDEEGNWESRDVNLAERIINENGHFVFQQ